MTSSSSPPLNGKLNGNEPLRMSFFSSRTMSEFHATAHESFVSNSERGKSALKQCPEAKTMNESRVIHEQLMSRRGMQAVNFTINVSPNG